MTLIVGYGNELRGDDALGCKLAEACRDLGYEVRIQHQLLPELADDLRHYQRVIFADAACDQAEVEFRRIEADLQDALPVHGGLPAQLLGLCQHLYGTSPEGWWLTMPGRDFGFHQGLSPTARLSLAAGLRLLSPDPRHTNSSLFASF